MVNNIKEIYKVQTLLNVNVLCFTNIFYIYEFKTLKSSYVDERVQKQALLYAVGGLNCYSNCNFYQN